MLFRFSLYGFLKNQRYFEPFLLLALLERGCSYTQIGLFIALREVVMQVFEVPSGALADGFGRRRVMVVAFAAYVVAYLLLGLGPGIASVAAGMGLIGFGDAFRSGTHKSMIFAWLRGQGRTEDKVEVYGFTRSWSKIGSMVAIPIAAGIAVFTGRYADAFVVSAIPAALDTLNLATYPAELDGPRERRGWRASYSALRHGLRRIWDQASLRQLLWQAMAFGGTYKALKDYVQPLLVAAAGSMVFFGAFDTHDRTSVVTGAVYFVLFGLGALAARHAHRWRAWFGSPSRAWTTLWWAYAGALVCLLAALWWRLDWLAVAMFVLVGPLLDVFRPTLVSRIDDVTGDEGQATLLSLESQATSTATALLALGVGAAVDVSTAAEEAVLWPVAAVALAVVLPTALAVTLRGARPEPAS